MTGGGKGRFRRFVRGGGFIPGDEAVSTPVGSGAGLLDTRDSAGRLRGVSVSCMGVIGQGLEERLGPARAGLGRL